MNKTAIAALAFGLVAISSQAFALRIATVDIAKVFERYSGTETAKSKLKKQVEEEKGHLEKEQEALKKKLGELQAKKSVLTPAKYEEQEGKLAEEIKALQGKMLNKQNELQGQEKALTGQILDEIREVVQKVAKSQKFDFVLEQNAVLFGGDDITATVIKDLNGK